MDGMANICEFSINTVMYSKPKMLIGLTQKGMWQGTGVEGSPVMDKKTTGE